MSENDNNSYGVHLLVDFKPIEEADLLLVECDRYIEDTKQEMFVLPFMPTFSLIASNVRAWRNKRRDSRLMSVFSVLQPRIVNTEKALRRILGEVVEKKIALRMQAKHLQVRLEACIIYNREMLKGTDQPLEETRHYVEMLSNESKLLKDMMVFNKEILRMQAIEKHQKAPGQRWGHQHRRGGGSAIGDLEFSNDPEHKGIDERLVKFRETRENFVQLLGVILEKRGVQQSNIENCTWSLESLRGATQRVGIPTVLSHGSMTIEHPTSNNNNTAEDVSESAESTTTSSTTTSPAPSSSSTATTPATAAEVFDHSRCADCSYGYAMACDCMNHLTALQKQANDANTRLQLLVEARERMMESNELIIQLDQNPDLRNSLINGLPLPPLPNTLPNTPTKEQAMSNTTTATSASTTPPKVTAETTKRIPASTTNNTTTVNNDVDTTMLVAEAISIDLTPPVDY